MFNTQSDEFFTVLVGTDPDNAGTVNRSCMFETQDEAIDYIKDNSSWDCRPSGGSMDTWYDPASGLTYKIVPCDDCGRY